MLTFKVIAALLHYPDEKLASHADELIEVVRDEGLIRNNRLADFESQIKRLKTEDLLDLQAEYVETFDRGRARSLHLFEHVHGESRDRGQAMVELRSVYRENGFDIDVPELPDYLPMFLEYLSTRPLSEAVKWLQELAHIIALVQARLARLGSPWAAIMLPLLDIAGADPDDPEIKAQIAGEEPDDTTEALDQVWMEQPVTFGPDTRVDKCSRNGTHGGARPPAKPVKWVRTMNSQPANT